MRCGCVAPTTSTDLTTSNPPGPTPVPTAAVPRFTFGTSLWSSSSPSPSAAPGGLQLVRPHPAVPRFGNAGGDAEEKRPAATSDTLRIPARGASQWFECMDATPLVFASSPEETCTVCMARVHPGGDGIVTPCGHSFHGPCMSRWLARHRRCPVCNCGLDARVRLTYVLRATDPHDSSNDGVPSHRIPFNAPPDAVARQVHIHTDQIHIHHTTPSPRRHRRGARDGDSNNRASSSSSDDDDNDDEEQQQQRRFTLSA